MSSNSLQEVESTRRRTDNESVPSPVLTSSAPSIPSISVRRRTSVLINVAGVCERAEEQVLPSLFRPVGAALHATPTQLGMLTFARAITQALASPLAGLLGDRLDRRLVIGLGCVTWCVVTALIAAVTNFVIAVLLWTVNGVALAAIIPASQSLLADLYPGHERGKIFGYLYLTGAMGAMGATLVATNLGGRRFGWLDGWRLAFLLVATSSGIVGGLVLRYVHDPTARAKAMRAKAKAMRAKAKARRQEPAGVAHVEQDDDDNENDNTQVTWRDVAWLLKIPTFQIIVVQGIFGASPWNALAWTTYYLQLIGMSDAQASAVMAIFLVSSAIGGLLGGHLGDWASSISPHHGRIYVAQCTVAAGLPLSYWFFNLLPRHDADQAVAAYLFVAFLFGISISWAAPACNSPVFAEIVPARLRTSVYAYDRCLESALAACAAPLVGYTAERVYGFQGRVSGTKTATKRQGSSEAAILADLANAHALGNALLLCMMIPWGICLVFYTLLHWTFHRDRAAQLARNLRSIELTVTDRGVGGGDGNVVVVRGGDGL